MSNTVYDGRRSRIKRWMIHNRLGLGSGLALLVSSFLGSALFAHVLESSRPGISLVMQKLVHAVGGRGWDAAIAIAMLLASQWLRGKQIRVRQNDYNSTAQHILSDLRADPAARVPDFYLYLRAFETTGKLQVPLYLRVRRKCVWVAQQLVTDDLESYVSLATGSRAPLVALGRPGEAIGAGRILTDDASWKGDVVTLMQRAKGILLVPSDRDGTVWEMDTLRLEGLFSKVVFVMPPLSKGEYDTCERWNAAKRAMDTLGLEAPEHQDRGLLFRVGSDGKLVNAEPLMLSSPRKIHKALDHIFKTKQGKRIYKAIVRADKRASRAAFWGWLENARQLSVFPLVVLAILMPTPNVGFDPNESWKTVFQRFMTASDIAEYDDSYLLAQSAKYQTLKASVNPENISQLNQALLLRGLRRIKGEDLRAYYGAQGEMMARVNQKTCASIASGEVQPDTMKIAFTYIPSEHVYDFLHASTTAIVAGAEDAPAATPDKSAEAEAWQQFAASLNEKDSHRYQQLDERGTLTTDDKCWLLRTMWEAAGTLPDPQGTLWARTLAGMSAESSPGPEGHADKEIPQPHDQPDPTPQPEPAGPTEPARHLASERRPEPQRAAIRTNLTPSRQVAPSNEPPPSQPSTPAAPTATTDPTVVMLGRARTDLNTGRLVEPANDCALYWALQLTQTGSPQGADIEQTVLTTMGQRISNARATKNYISAIDDLNKLIRFYPSRTELVSLRSQIQNEQQHEAAEAQVKKFALQHRHVVVAGDGSLQQAFCVGVLELPPNGTARFDCVSTFDPQGRCDHLVFPRGAIKEVKFLKNGLLHVATRHMGNFDYYGDAAALQGAYEGLGLLAGR
jgi:hypothetical protein